MNSDVIRIHMQIYELGYLILPSITEDKLSVVVGKIKEVISKVGGVEIDGEGPFKHELAYPMSKTIGASRYLVTDAYLGWIKFELEPERTASIKTSIEEIEKVLRFLLIKAPRETTFTFAKAKAIMKEREEAKVAEEVAIVEEVI